MFSSIIFQKEETTFLYCGRIFHLVSVYIYISSFIFRLGMFAIYTASYPLNLVMLLLFSSHAFIASTSFLLHCFYFFMSQYCCNYLEGILIYSDYIVIGYSVSFYDL